MSKASQLEERAKDVRESEVHDGNVPAQELDRRIEAYKPIDSAGNCRCPDCALQRDDAVTLIPVSADDEGSDVFRCKECGYEFHDQET